ncbi:hypothetical protein C2S51_020983 [Perilla frutescens var. frutescens]|nr:hypothetical protein C2S51_020983 [Perilla frutescens var. frutescens]
MLLPPPSAQPPRRLFFFVVIVIVIVMTYASCFLQHKSVSYLHMLLRVVAMLERNGILKIANVVGNDDSLGKSKKGKKVQFDSKDSIETNTPKSNGKAHASDATGLALHSFNYISCATENYVALRLAILIIRPLKKHGVSDYEICLITNICPESVDEVFAVVPALKPKMRKLKDPLRIALDELANLKEALANLKNST